MRATAPRSPVIAAAGHELALLAFVGQELRRVESAAQLPKGNIDALRAFHHGRMWQIYQTLLSHFELQGDWRTARLVARALVRRAPDQAIASQQLGLAALRQGDTDEAFAQLRRAVTLGAQSPVLLRQLADLYLARDSAAEAILALRAADSDHAATSHIRSYETQADRMVAQERVRAVTNAPPRGGRLRENVERLTYFQEFLSKALLERRISPIMLGVLQRDLSERLRILVPLAHPETEQQQHSEAVAHEHISQLDSAPAPQSPTPPAPQPRAPFDWVSFWSGLFSERMLRALLYLGATLLVTSAFIWMAFNWGRFSALVQLGVLTGITGAFYGCGILVRNKLGLSRSGVTLIAIGASWVAVDGWALANPGLLNLDPAQAWLLISALCLAAYIATVLWLRAEVFSALAGLAGISLLLAALNITHVATSWWGSALLLLLIGFMAATQRLRYRPADRPLADPLIWIAQALVPVVLIGTIVMLRGSPLLEDRALLALNGWIGLGFYLLSLRALGGIGFEQAAAWIVPVALLFTAEALRIPRAWHGPLLLALTPAYLLIAPRRRVAYAVTKRPWLNYPLLWPAYGVAYTLALLALIWPGGTTTTLCVGAFGVAALYAASARIFRRPLWAWLACATGLLACWRLLELLAMPTSSLSDITQAWSVVGVVYWAVGVALYRAPRYARAPLTVGYELLLITLILSFALPAETQRTLLPIAIGVSLISAWQAWHGRLSGLYVFAKMQPADAVPNDEPLASFFVALGSLLLACWLSLQALQAGFVEVGVGQALLAGGYFAAGWLLGRAGLPQARRALIGMAVGLTLLAALAVPAGATLPVLIVLFIGWVLALVVPWNIGSPWMSVLDDGALALGLGTLAILRVRSDDSVLVPLLLANAGAYLLSAALFRRAAGLYAAGGLLLGAWLAGLRWLDIPLAAQGAWLAPLALLAIAAALLLERRGWPDFARPAFLYGYGISAVSLIGCLAAYGTGALGVAELGQGAVALAALAALAFILALHTQHGVFVALSVVLPPLAYLLALAARVVPLGRYGLAFAGLAAVYLGLVLVRHRRTHAGEGEHTLQLRFDQALFRCGHILTAVALLLGMLGGMGSLALICLYGTLAYGLAAGVLRRPSFVAVAALLFPTGATLFFLANIEPLLGTATPLALLWLLLAWAMIALGLRLRRAPPAYVAPLHTIGLTLAALAPLYALDDRPVLLIALGWLVLLCIRWAWVARDARFVIYDLRLRIIKLASPIFLYPVAALAPAWVVLLADLAGAGQEGQALALALCAPAALAVSRLLRGAEYSKPFLLACYALTVLAMLAGFGLGPVLVLALNVGLYLWLMHGGRGIDRGLTIALWAAFALAGIATWAGAQIFQPPTLLIATAALLFVSAGLLLAIFDQAISRMAIVLLASPLISALAVANVRMFSGLISAISYASPMAVLICASVIAVYGALAVLERQPFWSIPAALTAPAMLMLAVSAAWQHGLPGYPTALAGALALFALGSIGLAWRLDRRLQRTPQQEPTSVDQEASPFTLPVYAAAGASGLVALLILILQSPGLRSPSTVLVAMGLAICYTLFARRFQQPFWLYMTGMAATTAYLMLLNLLAVPPPWRGVVLLPGIFATFAVGRHLHERDWTAPDRRLAWALPPYLFATVGSLAAVAWSLAWPWPVTLALLGATALYARAALLWRTRPWFSAALFSGHLCYLAALDALALLGSRDQQALWLLLPAIVMTLAGRLAELRAQHSQAPPTGQLRLLAHYLIGNTAFTWSQGFYLAAFIDMALVLVIPSTPGVAMIVAWVVAALLALVATAWRERALALLALALLALGFDALLVVAEASVAVRCSTLALQGVVAWWIGQALRWWRQRAVAEGAATLDRPDGMWAAGLQAWGLLANGAAVLLALVPLLMEQDTLPFSRVLAIAGLLCIGKALVDRWLRLSYLGSAMLVGAWFLTVPPGQPQFYAFPAGLYLLAVGAAERWHGAPRRLVQLIELLGMSILLTVSFEQSLPANFSYGMLLGFEALAIIFWGALQRVRLLFFGGIVAFLANLATQSIGPIQAMDKALLAFAVGLTLVVTAVYVERRRDELRERARHLLAQLETWS